MAYKVSTSTSPAKDSFQGLREQIIANASVLFPQIAAISPVQPFQIITTGSDHKRALLLYPEGTSMKIAARGPHANDTETALRGLLDLLSEALDWYTETLLGELEHGEEVAGGEINFLMVETGFHFVHEQRAFEKG